MNEKAFVKVADWGRNDGPWALYVDAVLGLNATTIERIPVLSSPDSASPAGGWKPLVRDAVVAAALAQLSIVVDEVVFPDLTSLTV